MRSDIRMFGCDLKQGEFADKYEAWEAFNLNDREPDFGGETFNAIYSSHLIEHIARPAELLAWMGRQAEPDATLYLEWPSAYSLELPKRDALAQRGFEIPISEFHDDGTHTTRPTAHEVARWVEAAGFEIMTAGVIDLGWLGEEMLVAGRKKNDNHLKLVGYWSVFRWCDHIIARKTDTRSRVDQKHRQPA